MFGMPVAGYWTWVSFVLYIMKFKILKTSKSGLKFSEMIKNRDLANEDTKRFADKYNIKEWRGAYWVVFGGMSSCIFDEKPDTKIWGKGASDGEYFPKRNTKIGKAIYKEIQDLKTVEISELNLCVGYKGAPFKTIGFDSGNKKYFLIALGDDWIFTPPKDCKEITTSEYKKLGCE